MGIKLIKKTNESSPKAEIFELEVRGDKVGGGFGGPGVYKLATKTDIPLYILSGDPRGSYEMLKVTSTKAADAKKVDDYNPAEWGDGYVLVTGDNDVKPWPVNWLTVDDADRVYIDVANLSKAVEFLTKK